MCRYEVIMTQDHNNNTTKYKGVLWVFNSMIDSDLPITIEKSVEFDFDPCLILGDLRHQSSPYIFSNGRSEFKETLYQHQLSYEYEYAFNQSEPLRIEDSSRYTNLINIINNLKTPVVSQKYLEEIQKECSSVLNYTIYIKRNFSETPIYALLKSKQRHSPQYVYEELLYQNGTTNKLLIKNKYLLQNHKICYKCLSMTDVIFAIFHFLALHNFSFRTCNFCSKLYSRPPYRKGIFSGCDRKNPYDINDLLHSKKTVDEYAKSDKLCKDAIKYLKLQIRNDRKCIQTHLGNYAPDNLKYFNANNDPLIKDAQKNPCYNTLKQLALSVNRQNRKRWYNNSTLF